MSGITRDEVNRRCKYYPPNDEAREKHERARDMIRAVGGELADLLPEGREKSIVFTKLEEAMMWANAAIARPPAP